MTTCDIAFDPLFQWSMSQFPIISGILNDSVRHVVKEPVDIIEHLPTCFSRLARNSVTVTVSPIDLEKQLDAAYDDQANSNIFLIA